MSAAIRRATVVSFSAATWQAVVMLDGALTDTEMPVGEWIASDMLAADDEVAVLLFNDADPDDGLVLGAYGAVQAAITLVGLNLGSATGAGAGDLKLSGSIRQSTPLAARVYNSANISLNDSTTTALTFDSERFDTDGIHSTSSNTGRLTCATAGKYLISATVRFDSNAVGYRQLLLKLTSGGSPASIAATTLPAVNGAVTDLTIATIYDLAAGDYVELEARQNSGGALNVLAGGNYSPELMMARLA